MTSRPPSSAGTTSRGGTTATAHPTPHHRSNHHSTASHHPPSTSRSTSKTRIPPPQAPKASRRGTDSSTTSSHQTNPVFNLGPPQTLVPRASCGKPDDILAPPDAQSCPFAKAGLKMTGVANGPYGELDQIVDFISQAQYLKNANQRMEDLNHKTEHLRAAGHIQYTFLSLKGKVEKLKEDEWMYSSVDTLYKRS